MLVVTCFLNIIQAQTFYFDIHRYTDGNETVALWHAFRRACSVGHVSFTALLV